MAIDDELRESFLKVTDKSVLLELSQNSSNEIVSALKDYFLSEYSMLYSTTVQQYSEEGESGVLCRVIRRLPEESNELIAKYIQERHAAEFFRVKNELENYWKNYDFSKLNVEEINWRDRKTFDRLD